MPGRSGRSIRSRSPSLNASRASTRRFRWSPICCRPPQQQFQFTPQRPASELEFKRAYARVAAAAGLTREQAVRVYSFETGGTGNYDVQSGIEHGGTRAISTAIGYNQLLTTNSVELVAEQGHGFVSALTGKGRATVRRRARRRWTTRSRC